MKRNYDFLRKIWDRLVVFEEKSKLNIGINISDTMDRNLIVSIKQGKEHYCEFDVKKIEDITPIEEAYFSSTYEVKEIHELLEREHDLKLLCKIPFIGNEALLIEDNVSSIKLSLYKLDRTLPVFGKMELVGVHQEIWLPQEYNFYRNKRTNIGFLNYPLVRDLTSNNLVDVFFNEEINRSLRRFGLEKFIEKAKNEVEEGDILVLEKKKVIYAKF